MQKSRLGWALVLIAVGLFGLAWIAYSKQPANSLSADSNLTEAAIAGYLAPQFTLKNTFGEDVSLDDYRGRPVVLNFWASWCPPCRAEIPHFQDASTKYNGQVAVLGVDQGEPLSIVGDFSAAFGVTYPLLLDSDNSVSRDYGVVALPKTVFIDSDGVVRELFTGIVNRAVLQDRIEKLLSEG